MASKADDFRYFDERSGPKKAPRPGNDRPGRPTGTTARRNWSKRAGKKAYYVLEDSPNGRPSRKSTRRSASHVKPAHPLTSSKRVRDEAAVMRARARMRRS